MKENKPIINVSARVPAQLHLAASHKFVGSDQSFQSLIVDAIKAFVDQGITRPAFGDVSIARYMETFPAATPMEESYRKLVRMILEGYAEWAAQDLSQQANSETSESENV